MENSYTGHALRLMNEAEAMAYGTIPRPAWMRGVIGPLTYAVVARCLSRHRAIRRLLEAGYQDEAMIVFRSLLTDSARLEFMAAHPENRESNGLWWWMSQIKELDKLGRAIGAMDGEEAASIAQSVHVLREALRERQTAAGLSQLQAMPAEGRGMALALGKPAYEVDYILATHPSHTTLGSLLTHYQTEPDGTTTYNVESHNEARLVSIAFRATTHFLSGTIAAGAMLEWTGFETLRAFAAATQREFEGLEDHLA